MKIGKITAFGITIGAIASSYVSYVLNGTWHKGMDISTFTDTFMGALQHPSKEYYNDSTVKAIVYGLIIYGMVVLMYLTSRRNLMIGKEYGTAKFADIKLVNKRLADKDKRRNRILSKRVRMSTDTRKTMINNNLLVIGGSGAGKTFFMVKPNIMQLLPDGSFICTDPKGEVARATGNMLKRNGYNVKVINLIDMSKSDCYNPFRYIREENDVIKLVTNIISNTTPKDGAPTDPFWTNAEGLLLQSLFYYVWLEMPEKKQNFRTVMELLSEAKVDPKGKDSKLTTKMKNLEKTSALGRNHPALKQYMKVVDAAGDTVRSIIISANARLALLENPQILRVLSRDDLKLEELGIGVNGDKETRTALFCIIPDSDKSYNFIIGMLYTQLFQELYFQADFKCGGRLPLQVNLLMDEFANVALPEDFCSLLSTMRSRGISSTIIIQNLAQIKALFKETWETITGNCDTLVYLGGNEKSTHQYISEMLGKSTIDKRSNGETRGLHGSSSRNYDVLGRELMTPDEVRNMSNKKCLIFIRGFDPIFDDKYVPKKHKKFKQTEDGGAKPYVHIPTVSSQATLVIMSDNQIKELIKNKKPNEKMQVMELSIEEIMMLGDTSQIYFGEGTNVSSGKGTKGDKSDKSESADSNNNEGEHLVITRQKMLESLSDEELKEEMTSRLFDMEFEPNQIEELQKALDAHMKLSLILSYLYPTTSAEEMRSRREQYLKSKGE